MRRLKEGRLPRDQADEKGLEEALVNAAKHGNREGPGECVPPEPGARPPVVLVADDEPSVRALLEATLPRYGFDVLTAADGSQAVEVYLRHQADVALVLLDVNMPGLDGPHAFVRLRQIDPGARVCFMSGGAGADVESVLLAVGAAGFLPKPFRVGEVAAALWALLGHAS
jgi:CheY-like chemotaxis protein